MCIRDSCQAGGSDPRYVSLTYERLLARYPKTSLLLRCCGAPALWAGEEAAFGRELEQITLYWREAGEPAVILACPTCHRIFREYLPEIPVKMVYDLPEIWTGMASPFEEASVFDPCASRDYPCLLYTSASGEYFVGDLIYAGELMTQAVEILRTALAGGGGAEKGRMIMCTVKGDLHDIGKNIVIAMLEASGFEVLDLGIDVAPETIVETAKKEGIHIIALSGVCLLYTSRCV